MASSYLTRIISRNFQEFNDTETKIASYFIANEDSIINKTISNLSTILEVSEATIFKFVKKIGFSGFQDFKISVASNLTQKIDSSPLLTYSEITAQDSPNLVAQKIVSANIHDLNYLLEQLPKIDFKKINILIEKAPNIYFIGVGGSSTLAFDSYHKFLRTNLNCHYAFDSHIQLTMAAKSLPDELVFLFSHSGNSAEIITTAKIFKQNKTNIISLTGNPKSKLAKLSDISIIVNSSDALFRTESLASRLLYLTIMDSIFVNILLNNPDSSAEIINKIRDSLKTLKN